MSQSATPATQNDMTTCLETFEKKRFCSFPNRHGDATGKPEIPDETRGTFEKERFCGFPHRHGEATGKVETRDETRGSTKTSISYETSGNFQSWQHDKRTGFAASPIDTAKPRENQRLETRHVRAPKRAFCARLPPIFTLCSFKIDVFLRVFPGTSKFCYLKIDVSCEASVNFHHISQNATPATEFAPCRHLTQPWQCDSQKKHYTTRLQRCACHEKLLNFASEGVLFLEN